MRPPRGGPHINDDFCHFAVSQTTVIDGRNGAALLLPYIHSSVGAQTSPLTISVEGSGHDIFLHWNADCVGHEGQGGKYDFVKV